jgi:nitrite reductase/ring-hydroxylating ferredoxin subunit
MHRVENVTLPREGELLSVDVAGTQVAVTVVDGVVYAVDDECTHQACSLSDGDVEGLTVVCPCHQGTVDLTTGAGVSGPPERPVGCWKATLRDGALELQR